MTGRDGRCPTCDHPMYALAGGWYCPNEGCKPGGLFIPFEPAVAAEGAVKCRRPRRRRPALGDLGVAPALELAPAEAAAADAAVIESLWLEAELREVYGK